MAPLGSIGLDENTRSLLEQVIQAVRELTEQLREYNESNSREFDEFKVVDPTSAGQYGDH